MLLGNAADSLITFVISISFFLDTLAPATIEHQFQEL